LWCKFAWNLRKRRKESDALFLLTNAADRCKFSAEGITRGKVNTQREKELMYERNMEGLRIREPKESAEIGMLSKCFYSV